MRVKRGIVCCVVMLCMLMGIATMASLSTKSVSAEVNTFTADEVFTVHAGATGTATLTANAEGARNYVVFEGKETDYVMPKTLSMKVPAGAQDSYIESPTMYGAFTTKFLPKPTVRGTADFTTIKYEFVDAVDPSLEKVTITAKQRLAADNFGATYGKIFVKRLTQIVGGGADNKDLLWGGFTLETNNVNMFKFDTASGEVRVGNKETPYDNDAWSTTNINWFDDKTYTAFPNGYKVRIYLEDIVATKTAELLIEEMSGVVLSGATIAPQMALAGEFPTIATQGATVSLPNVTEITNSLLGKVNVTPTLTVPNGSATTLVGNTFVPDKVGEYKVIYSGAFNGNNLSAEKIINVTNDPVFSNAFDIIKANLGSITVSEGLPVVGTGVGAVTATYALTTIPTGSTATLKERTFVADKEGTYVVTCTLTDSDTLPNTAVQTQTIIVGKIIAQNAFLPSDTVKINSNSTGKSISETWEGKTTTISTAGLVELIAKENNASIGFATSMKGDFDISLTPLATNDGVADYGALNIYLTSTSDPTNKLKLMIDKDGWGAGKYSFLRTEYKGILVGGGDTGSECPANQVLFGGFKNQQPGYVRVRIIDGKVYAYNGDTQRDMLVDLKTPAYESKFVELQKGYKVDIEFVEIVASHTATVAIKDINGQTLSGDSITEIVEIDDTKVLSKAEVGKEYKLPTSRISSLFGDIEVTSVTSEGVTIVNGKFTPDTAKDYVFKSNFDGGFLTYTVTAIVAHADNTVINATNGSIAFGSTYVVAVPTISSKLDIIPTTAITKIEYKLATAKDYIDITTAKSFATSVIGDYLVKFTATDYNGTITTKEITVTSVDSALPIFDTAFTLPNGIAGIKYTVNMITATDNSGKATVTITNITSPTNEIILLDETNSFVPTVVGEYSVTYEASDDSLNTDTKICKWNILADTELPIITLSDKVTTGKVGTEITLASVSNVTDNVTTGLTATVKVTDANGVEVNVKDNKFVPSKEGKYLVTYTSTADGAGNVGTTSYEIVVTKEKKEGCGSVAGALASLVMAIGAILLVKNRKR